MRSGLILLLVCGAAAAQQEPERTRHAYDVMFLTHPVEDFPAPALADPNSIPTETSESGAEITGEFLTSAIVTNFESDSWNDSRNSIEYGNGVLYVVQTRDVHKLIADYLDMLRKRLSRRVAVDADVFLVAPAVLEGTGAGVLTADQEKAIRDAGADPARGTLLTTLRAVAMNGQRVHAADFHDQTYVRDYDIEIAQGAAIADPIVGVARNGAVLDVRPFLAPDGASAMIETRFEISRPGATASFDPAAEPLGVIQEPSQIVARAKSTIGCPMGRSILLTTASSPAMTEKGWMLAVLLRPTLLGDAPAAAPESKEKRQMRLYDVSTIVARVPDFPGPMLGLASSSGGETGAPATSFVPASDEGLGLDMDALLALVRSNVMPDSWNNSKNQLFSMDNQIVAVQTPDVLEAIARFLSDAAPQRARLVSVDAAVVGLDDASWSARRNALTGGKLSEADAKALFEAASKGEGTRLAALVRGVGMNNQRWFSWSGGRAPFVQDYDVEIAQSARATDPVIGELGSGLELDVRGTLAGDGKRIILDLRPVLVTAAPPATWDTKGASVGLLQKMKTSSFGVRTQATVEDGAWTMVGLTSRGVDAGGQGQREVLVMLVRARSLEVK